MPANSFKIIRNRKDQTDKLTLHLHKKNVKGSFYMIKFIDKDTNQIVYYVPSLEITGYGSMDTQTLEMIKFSILEWFKFIISLSQKKRDEELISLGWKKDKIKNKEFSNTFINKEGELKSFNAVDNTVEHLSLEAQ